MGRSAQSLPKGSAETDGEIKVWEECGSTRWFVSPPRDSCESAVKFEMGRIDISTSDAIGCRSESGHREPGVLVDTSHEQRLLKPDFLGLCSTVSDDR